MLRFFYAAVLLCWASLSFGLSDPARAETPKAAASNDVVARVGAETITFTQLNTMMNSSPVVGLSLPALGTPERNRAMVVLLDKAISANLLYLNAKAKGLDRDETYLREVKRFEEDLLAGVYRARRLAGEIPVTAEEVQAFYDASVTPGTELTDDLKTAIEASIRKRKFKARVATEQERLRREAKVVIREENLDGLGDDERDDAVEVASVEGVPVTWGEVKARMRRASRRSEMAPMLLDEDDERLAQLRKIVDMRLMAQRARSLGFDRDPVFRARMAEFRKTRLINLHRGALARALKPSDEQLREYFAQHEAEIGVPEARKVQMVVLASREEAEAVKARIDANEITLYQAAVDYSIHPRAKFDLGEIGWVSKGSGFPELDELTFMLEPGQLGGPVESPAGWHLVKVLDVRDARLQYFEQPQTRQAALRRYMHEKMDRYVVELRQKAFPVEVYEDVLNRKFKQEAEWIASLNEKAQKPGSVTKQRVKDLEKFYQ